MARYKVECPGCEIENEEASAQEVLRAAYVAACIEEHEVRRHGKPEELAPAQKRVDDAEDAIEALTKHLEEAEALVKKAQKRKRE